MFTVTCEGPKTPLWLFPGFTRFPRAAVKTKSSVQSWQRTAHRRLLRAPVAQLLLSLVPDPEAAPLPLLQHPASPPPTSSNYRRRRLGKGQLVRETRRLRGARADRSSRSAATVSSPQAPAAALPAWPTALAAWEPPRDTPSGLAPTAVMDPAAWRGAKSRQTRGHRELKRCCWVVEASGTGPPSL